MAVDSFKNITMSFKGTGLNAIIDDVTVTRYATSLKGLTLEQANLALSTTQLSAREKELILTEAGLITSTQTLTAQEMVSSFQKEIGNKKDAERILIRAKLVTATELEEDATVKLTLAQIQLAVAKGRLSVEDAKLLTTTFGITGANYGEAVSFEVLTKAIWGTVVTLGKFLFTNPVGWLILATGAIAGTVAILEHFTVSLEESKEQLSNLKTECNNIESDLSSMNDELKTTADRMKELEGKDTLTFTEKEEYDNLVKTNKELQRKIDLLELEQEINNREKNKTFIQTMVKDTNNPFEYEVNPDGKKSYGQYSIGDEYSTNEIGYIKAQFEARKNLLDELSKAETQEEKDRIQASIDEIDSFLQSKNKEWSEISQDISYIPNPTTDDDKAVNEWLDYINDFQDKMAIALGSENAKTNAFNRLVDNWQFDGLVQGLQDLGEQGQVTAEMLNDPKYDEFIQKLVELGVIDSVDNLNDIALAFNGINESTSDLENPLEVSFDISTYQEQLETVYGNIEKLQDALTKLDENKFDFSGDIQDLIKAFPEYSTEILNASGDTEQLRIVLQGLLNSQPNNLIKSLTALKSSLASDEDIKAVDNLINILRNSTSVAYSVSTLSDTLDDLNDKESILSTVWKEMNEDGHISVSTYKSLCEMGDDYANTVTNTNGILTTTAEKIKEVIKKNYDLEIATKRAEMAQLQYNAAVAGASGGDTSAYVKRITQLDREIKAMESLGSYDYTADDKEEPESVKQFKKDLAKKEHLLNTNQISEQEYYNWLDSESKRVYGNLADYEEDLWKYEEEVYKWRQEQEQDLFDQKIENLDKEKDKALENNDFETAKTVVNTQITETQNRIIELKASGRQDVDDEIKQLEEDLDDLNDTLNDIFSKEYEFKISVSDDAIENIDERIEKGDITAFEDKATEIQKKIAETDAEINRLLREGLTEDSDAIRNLRNDLEDFDKELSENSKKEYEFKVSLKTNEIDDLDREFEKSGDTSIYDKQIGIYEGLIGDTQDEINRLLDLGYSMDSEEIQSLLDDMNGYSDKIADIWDKQTEIIKDNVDEQIKALDRNIENTGDTSLYADKIKVYEQAQKDIYDRIEFYRKQGYAEDSQIIKDLKEQWVEYGEAITDTLQEQADAQIEAYSELMDEQKEILEKQKETQDELFDSQITALEKQKEALEDVNEQLEKENTLNEKIKAIEDARNNVYKNRRMVYTVGGGWEIKDRQEDLDKVKEAQKDYSDELRQQEIDKIQDQIDAIEEAKSAFDETIDKQIKAIEESEKSFEEAMKASYEIRKKLDREFIASIVGEDKADEYLANANVATSDTEKDKQKNNTTSTTGNNTGGTQNNREYNSFYSNPTEKKSDETKSDEITKTLSSTDLAIQKMYEMFSNKGAFTRNVTLDQFVSDLQNGVLLKPVGANDVFNPNVLDTGKSNGIYNTINNNSPVFNIDINVNGRDKDDVALANQIADIAEQKVITGLQAFNAGVHNASSTRRSTKR